MVLQGKFLLSFRNHVLGENAATSDTSAVSLDTSCAQTDFVHRFRYSFRGMRDVLDVLDERAGNRDIWSSDLELLGDDDR
jgi:hypothetical protein